MNRNELAQKISSHLQLRTYMAKDVLDLICDEIAKALQDGQRVYLQKLGALHVVTRKARRRYDPNTGKVRTNPAHKDVIFRPGKQLLRRVGRAAAKRR